jgi:solute carrier family 9 (sodium/hydrogen exchanger), member 6/7
MLHRIGIFLVSFSLSVVLGVSFDLGMSLIFKHSQNDYPPIGSFLIVFVAYTCYIISNGLFTTGIISVPF